MLYKTFKFAIGCTHCVDMCNLRTDLDRADQSIESFYAYPEIEGTTYGSTAIDSRARVDPRQRNIRKRKREEGAIERRSGPMNVR